jgi:hypothetical protein
MAVPNPSQIFSHALDYLKGWWHQHVVDFVGMLDPATDPTAQPAFGGRVVHVSSNTAVVGGAGRVDSLFQLGAVKTQMPIFLNQNQTDPDVSNPGAGMTDAYGWTAGTAVGFQSGLVASGAYELQSTEFDKTAGVVYNPNDPLHSPTVSQITGSDKSAAGMLFKNRNWPGGDNGAITPYTDAICAIVSRGRCTNHNRVQVISFWPYMLPGTEGVS